METKQISARLFVVLLMVTGSVTLMAQTKLVAYSLKSGSYATNGQTSLWSNVGGISAKEMNSGTTTLASGVFGQGFYEIILGIINELEGEVIIVQNLNLKTVTLKNSSNRRIVSSRVINTEGRTMSVNFDRESNDSKFSFKTNHLTPGVYLLQINLQGLPVTKKFLVK